MMSPILTSLKFSRPTPHSLPLTTSLGVVLEALEGADLAGVDHHAVAEQAHAGVTGDLAVGHIGTGDDADLGHA